MKMNESKQHFSIRKLTIGAASVLIGTTFYLTSGQTVHADTLPENSDAQVEQVSKAQDSAQQDDQKTDTQKPADGTENAKVDTAQKLVDDTKTAETPVAKPAAAAQQDTTNSQNSTPTTSTQTHANGTGGYTMDGITVPPVDESLANKFWDAFNEELPDYQPDVDLAKLGLDENAYFSSVSSDAERTKWHEISWLELYDENGEAHNVGTLLFHNADGTLATVMDKNNQWLTDAVANTLINTPGLDDYLNYAQKSTEIPLIDAAPIYVHQDSPMTFDDIKKSLGEANPNNLDGLVSGEWLDPQEHTAFQKINTSVAGTQTGAANVTYGNNSQVSVSIPVTVVGPNIDGTIHLDQDDPIPDASTYITNDDEIQKYFPGTTYSWKNTPTTANPGDFDAIIEIHWPDGTTTDTKTNLNVKQMYQIKDQDKTVTRTIVDNVPHQDPVTTTQSVTLTHQVKEDMNGKELSETPWTAKGDSDWASYTAKGLAGYTPNIQDLAKETVNGDTKDTTVTITYTANDQSGKIIYVDQNGQTVSTTPLTGKTDETITITPQIPTNWTMVSGQDIPKTEIATANGIPDVEIQVEHGTKDVTSDHQGDTDPNTATQWTVTETITVTNPNGQTSTPVNQTVTFNRTATEDLVTGDITYGAWDKSSYTFDAYTAPTIKGYTADKSISAQTVKPGGDKKLSFNIAYTKNAPIPVKSDKDHPATETITRTITFDGVNLDPVTQEVDFSRIDGNGNIGYQDPATDEITYNAWTPANGTFASYTPQTITINDNDIIVTYLPTTKEVPSENVTPDSKNETVVVKYNSQSTGGDSATTDPLPIKTVIVYKDGNGDVVDTKDITGKPGDKVTPQIPNGYTGTDTPVTIPENGEITVGVVKKETATGGDSATADPLPIKTVIVYKDGNGDVVGTEDITGKPGDKVTPHIPDGYTGTDTSVTIPENGVIIISVVKKQTSNGTPADSDLPNSPSTTPTPDQTPDKHNSTTNGHVLGNSKNEKSTGVKATAVDTDIDYATKSNNSEENSNQSATGNELPQTGEKETSTTSVFGMLAIALGGLMGLGVDRKKKRN